MYCLSLFNLTEVQECWAYGTVQKCDKILNDFEMENTYNVSHTYETNEMWTTIILVKHVKTLVQ